MTYDEFINQVSSLLLYDALEDDEQHTAFIDQHIRAWMGSMQYLISNFKVGNESTYSENDFTLKCKGGILSLPSTLQSLTSVHLVRQTESDCDPITYESDGETVSVDYSNEYNNGIVFSGFDEVNANGIYTPTADKNEAYTWSNGEYDVESNGDGSWFLYRRSDSGLISTFTSLEKVPVGAWESEDGLVTVVEFCESGCAETTELMPVKWNDRDSVLEGDACFSYSIDPRATTAYIFPVPENRSDRDDDTLRICWDGVKSNYDGEDKIPFSEDTTVNCAHYLNAQLARKKEDKLSNYNSYYSSYLEGRKEIALAQRDKSRATT